MVVAVAVVVVVAFSVVVAVVVAVAVAVVVVGGPSGVSGCLGFKIFQKTPDAPATMVSPPNIFKNCLRLIGLFFNQHPT